jgi:hypothetical protein
MKKLILFAVVIFVAIVIISTFIDPKPDKPPLDYSKRIYTDGHAIVCPLRVLLDVRFDRGREAISNMYLSDKESEAEHLGCEVWQGGIEVEAAKMEQTLGGLSLVQINGRLFTVAAHLTNKVPQ